MKNRNLLDGLFEGTVTNWSDRGYGFIRVDAGGPLLFLHTSEITGVMPGVGDRVRFRILRDKGKFRATRASKIEKEE
jgi:cold shock CspA family protein